MNFNETQNRFFNNLNGFRLTLGGELNEPMDLTYSVGYSLSYQILESDASKLSRWDYIIARKNISDLMILLKKLNWKKIF